MEELINFIISIYVYCTDFSINLANILNLSYYEINVFVFCILWPLITIVLVLIRIMLLGVKRKVWKHLD